MEEAVFKVGFERWIRFCYELIGGKDIFGRKNILNSYGMGGGVV